VLSTVRLPTLFHLLLCSTRNSYGFGTAWGWVNGGGKKIHFWVNCPFKLIFVARNKIKLALKTAQKEKHTFIHLWHVNASLAWINPMSTLSSPDKYFWNIIDVKINKWKAYLVQSLFGICRSTTICVLYLATSSWLRGEEKNHWFDKSLKSSCKLSWMTETFAIH